MTIFARRTLRAALAVCILVTMTDCSRSAPAANKQTGRTIDPAVIPPTVVGMNVGVPSYWSAEWAFADQIKNTGDFTAAGQNQFAAGKLSAGGFPTNADKKMLSLLFDVGQTRRSGDYDCVMSPGWSAGTLYPGQGGSVKGSNREHFTLAVPPWSPPGVQVVLQVTPDREGANLDKLSCRLRGEAQQLFNPTFLIEMKPFGVLRFMDWMKTNNAGPQTWANRPLPTDLSLIPRGASVEDMVALANQMHSDPWFTMPFDADDAYYRGFATYVRDHLDKGLRAYVEYSNEVWNPSFRQSQDATSRGKQRYPGTSDQQANDFYYGDRVRDVMKVWDEVFAGQNKRIVRVASTQTGWVERAGDVLGHNDTYKSVDALAIAPYFGTGIDDVPEQGKPRVDKVLARLAGQAQQVLDVAVRTKAIANKYGIELITYEGGPDVNGFNGQAGHDAWEVVHDPRIYDVYMNFLKGWRQRVGGLIVLYDSTGASNFSHSDYTGQPLEKAPKMRAAIDFAKSLPAPAAKS